MDFQARQVVTKAKLYRHEEDLDRLAKQPGIWVDYSNFAYCGYFKHEVNKFINELQGHY